MSIATVSFVLNKRAGETISEKVRRRVTEAAEQLDYHPSASARGLARQRTHNLALVFYRDASTIANAFYSYVVQGIIKETTRQSYNLLFSFVDDEYAGPKQLPQALRERNAEGVLLMHFTSHAMVNDIRALGVPIAAIDVVPPLEDTIRVDIDNHLGATLATQHLLGLGHRRLAFIYGAPERASIAGRRQGFTDALRQAGVRMPRAAALHDCGELTHEAGYQRARRILAQKKPPTGIFCANDELAAGVLRAAHELGIGVPAQLSVVGFDDIAMSHFTDPPLTTISVDKEGMGRLAVAALIQVIDGQASVVDVEPGAVRLVSRQSSGPVPRT